MFRTLLILSLFGFFGCGSQPQSTALFLEVRSEAPLSGSRIDRIRFLMRADAERFPLNASDPNYNWELSGALDPVQSPVFILVEFGGKSFSKDRVSVELTGFSEGKAVARYQGPLDLKAMGTFQVQMVALAPSCDLDSDGFVDCNAEVGCCAGSDDGFSDCLGDDPDANPWALEPECEPCDDLRDQNCDGSDVPCVDLDEDGVADCEELLCGAQDGSVGPGLPELCDGVDNNCDGEIDEGFSGAAGPLGTACGFGACAGGTVVCLNEQEAGCSTAELASFSEVCDNGIDDDCNGLVDDGCSGDVDGDGFIEDDCNPVDAGFFPGAEEPCCPSTLNGFDGAVGICDRNCDGVLNFCVAEDLDGDGYWGNADCDETDPSVHNNAPEKCGDGIDQNCFDGDLPCDGVIDQDGDQWPADVDCDDNNPAIHPGADESCDAVDNDCDGLIDEGNPGTEGGALCGACKKGVLACTTLDSGEPGVLCFGDSATDEICDGVDNDCDGETDEGFDWKGIALSEACDGVGACGLGVVECHAEGAYATCSTMPDGSTSESTVELCDALDNDCDGEINEGLNDVADSDCLVAGLCASPGATVKASCDPQGKWLCNYEGVPGFEEGEEVTCDGLDNNCDGSVDEAFAVGSKCDGDDADSCAAGNIVCDASGKGAYCEELEAASPEVCDGLDNDCDGQIDEGYEALGEVCDSEDSDLCTNGVWACAPDGSGLICKESKVNIEEVCDFIDNDCDGDTDEGFNLGQACDGPDKDQCALGTLACGPQGGTWCVNESETNIKEICDGLDNDCDGEIDEEAKLSGLGKPCDGDDADLCAKGTWVCLENGSNNTFECLESGLNQVEICNSKDDDCDGQTDEGLGKNVACDGQDADACANGKTVCNPSDPKAPVQCKEPGPGFVEICDAEGKDEDCDGSVNEDWPALGKPCDGPDADACKGGVFVCAQGGDGLTCGPEGPVAEEVCNGLDDDCDGDVDEEVEPLPDVCQGVGVCQLVVPQCGGTEGWLCSPEGLDKYEPIEVSCDGLDNDCDGKVDNNLADLTCGLGECKVTVAACLDGVPQSCVPEVAAESDVCGDGLDNNCDGNTDEACCAVECPEPYLCAQDGSCEASDDSGRVYVPTGSFQMGCTGPQGLCALAGFANAKPPHEVTVSAFLIDRVEVTAGDYGNCVDAGVCEAPETSGITDCPEPLAGAETYDDPTAEDLPITSVTYAHAETYCAWKGARLCTEAEWERAARGDDDRPYPWGDTKPDCSQANFLKCGGELLPVLALPDGASPFGVFALSGNVSEWVADWYLPTYYSNAGPWVDPTGPLMGVKRVVRGGHLGASAYNVMTFRRYAYEPVEHCSHTGFRCCADVP